MNKVSRQNGKRSVNVPQASTAHTIMILNGYVNLINNPKYFEPDLSSVNFDLIEDFKIWGAPAEIVDGAPELENILRLSSTAFALDILKGSDFLSADGEKELIKLLKNKKHVIFQYKSGEAWARAYNDCLLRFKQIEHCFKVATELVINFKHNKDRINNIRADSKLDKGIVIYELNWFITTLCVSVVPAGNEKTQCTFQFKTNDLLESLFVPEIIRLGICPRCKYFYWIRRKDMTACAECKKSIANKKWRDKISQSR